eukprot:COSAG02_NODE_6725_length_3398_cov_79.417399_1_plen_357_part_00
MRTNIDAADLEKAPTSVQAHLQAALDLFESADDNEKRLAATQRLYDISQQIYWTEEWRSERTSQSKAGVRAKPEERTGDEVAADISLKELRDRLARTQGFADTASEIKAGVRAKLEERTGDKVAADISLKELQDRLARTQGFADTASEIKTRMRSKLEERAGDKVAADISLKELRNHLARTQGFADTASEIKAGMRAKLEEHTGDKVAADISGKELQDRLARTQGFADKASEIKTRMRAKLEERTGDKVAADISSKELQDHLAQTKGFADKASETKAGVLKATLKRFLAADGSDDQFEHLKSLSPTVLWRQARLELASTIDATPPEALSTLGLKRIINMRISLGLPGQIQSATKKR